MTCLAIVGITLQGGKAKPQTFQTAVKPVLTKYCISCHTGKEPPGGIDLVTLLAKDPDMKMREVWDKVATNIASSHMPPQGSPHPTAVGRKAISDWIQAKLAADCKLAEPGRVTIRRLNRDQYNNTIRDLVGVDFKPAEDFPSDDVGYGFDNIGDVLSMSPLHMEKYLAAAETIAEKAILIPRAKTVKFEGDTLKGKDSVESDNGGREMASTATAFIEPTFKQSGLYKLKIQTWGQQAGPEPCKMRIDLDGTPVGEFLVSAVQGKPQTIELPLNIRDDGKHHYSVEYTNDYYHPEDPNPNNRDRNLFVDFMEVVGPIDSHADLPESHRRIIPYAPTEPVKDARKMLTAFATKAYRRPVRVDEVDRLMKLFDLTVRGGESFERGMQLGVEAVLTSPNFLFLVEADANPKANRVVNDYELASRLSYFLWSSMPDGELMTLAAQGKLHNPATLSHETKRMLLDPKATSLADNFAGQWLQIRNLNTVAPDQDQFKDFNDQLRQSMASETKMFFMNVVRQDRPILDFIVGDYTFLNEPLAKHYGITGVSGNEFRKVNLGPGTRAGILTQASVLTVTSNPTRTSPTKRGKWILENILGTPPPPPPPGVGDLGDEKKINSAKTLRKLMEQHRNKPMCASCHSRMDPLGFGLENFDAVGEWRDKEGDTPIDSSGTLPDGRIFKGPAQLRQILMANKDGFARCLSEKLLTYALGRGVESFDKCAVDAIVKQTIAGNYKFSKLVTAIVTSDPFLKREGDKGSR